MNDTDNEPEGSDDWAAPPVGAYVNLVGPIRSVYEINDLPWSWGIAQSHLRQRCTFTRTFDD